MRRGTFDCASPHCCLSANTRGKNRRGKIATTPLEDQLKCDRQRDALRIATRTFVLIGAISVMVLGSSVTAFAATDVPIVGANNYGGIPAFAYYIIGGFVVIGGLGLWLLSKKKR